LSIASLAREYRRIREYLFGDSCHQFEIDRVSEHRSRYAQDSLGAIKADTAPRFETW